MRLNLLTLAFSLCLVAITLSSCRKDAATSAPAVSDPCALITKEEIEAVQGSPVKDTTTTAKSEGGYRVTQCFYTTAELNRSVSFVFTEADPESSKKGSPKKYWKESFGAISAEEKEREADQKKTQEPRGEEEAVPPRKITGVGNEALWFGSPVGGALYVLGKNVFFRISVGGGDTEDAKIDKSKALAAKALGRL